MRIAIVGTGISGLVVAHLLHPDHDLTIFEANDYVGGHTHTHRVEQDGREFGVDSGFIVFNQENYPNFVRLLDRLGVASQPSDMSFSVQCSQTGLEYSGSSLNALFAQRRNLVRPAFYRMLAGILRFNRQAPALLDNGARPMGLGEYLDQRRFSREFVEHYILPMGSAIWSCDPDSMHAFPARSFVAFLHNHGMLRVLRQPQWRAIHGGSRRYVDALIRPFVSRIQLRTPIRAVTRTEEAVIVETAHGDIERFDRIVIAAHSDQALRMLRDPTPQERAILGAIGYRRNDALLHTDASLLPRSRRAWSSWNYHIGSGPRPGATITYNMNRLQNLRSPRPFCVTLNRGDSVRQESVMARMTYHHPVYTEEAMAAQRRRSEINGVNRTYYCGAYWGYGFHEDGVNSALDVCRQFGRTL